MLVWSKWAWAFGILPVMLMACAGCGEDALVGARLLAPALANPGRGVRIDRGLAYKEVDGRVLRYDLFRPATADGPAPLIVIIYGNGWRDGPRDQLMEFAYDFAANGYAAAEIDYRPANGSTVTFPQLLEDIHDAVEHLRARSGEIGIAPDRVALFGGSSGAHLALLAGMPSETGSANGPPSPGNCTSVRAVVSISGPSDLRFDPPAELPWAGSAIEWLLGAPLAEASDLRRVASRVEYVRADGPAVFLVQGTADSMVTLEQSRQMRDALGAAGQACVYTEAAGLDHGLCAVWILPAAQGYRAALFEFLAEHLHD